MKLLLLLATLGVINAAVIPAKPKSSLVWSPWAHCPPDNFVSTLHIQYSSKPGQGYTAPKPLIGLQFTCTNRSGSSSGKDRVAVWNPKKSKSVDSSKSSCLTSEFHGLLTGLQFRQSVLHENSVMQKSILDVTIYCDDTIEMRQRKFVSRNSAVWNNSHWEEPLLCGWGEFVCAGRVLVDNATNQITNIEAGCCTEFTHGIGWRSYREVSGRVLYSPIPFNKSIGESYVKQTEIDEYFDKTFEHPYYQKWQFCPISTYVVGMHLNYPNRRVQLLCSDMSRPAPRSSSTIQMPEQHLIWENYDDISKAVKCDGVVIGLQVKHHSTDGIQGVRLICSFSEVEDELSYVEGRFPISRELPEDGDWVESLFCGRNQAVCGFKSLSINPLFQTTNSTLFHLKLKCCNVPHMAEICFPHDKYELVVECDATQAWADTTCQYTQTEGISISSTRSLGERRDEQLREVLSKEWTISDGVHDRESTSSGNSELFSVHQGETMGSGSSQGFSNSHSDARGGSSAINLGNSTGNSVGSLRGRTNSSLRGDSLEAGASKGTSHSYGTAKGEASGNSGSSMKGSSSSTGTSGTRSRSESSSDSNTEGVSTGTMHAVSKGESRSDSRSSSSSASTSMSNSATNSHTSSRSHTAGTSTNVGISTEVGFNLGFVSASLRTNFETGTHSSSTYGYDSTSSNTQSQSREFSNSQSNTVGRESSSSQSSQASRDVSQSRQQSTGQESGISHSVSQGEESSSSNTVGTHSEVNSQTNENKQTDQGSSQTNRTSLENSVQTNTQENEESNQSQNFQVSNETNSNFQSSRGNETSTNMNESKSRELQNQTSSQRGKEQSLERISTKGSQEGGISENGLTTGYDWSQTSGRTWNLEKSYQITMNVPAGMRSQLFQVVGKCVFYQVRTSKFKRVDYVADWAVVEGVQGQEGGSVE